MLNKTPLSFLLFSTLIFTITISAQKQGTNGSFNYSDFKNPQYCGSCHKDFFRQWDQAMMSKAYTHHWDEIEYFKLAIPHGEKDEKFKEASDGCNGCHTPIAFMAGDVPPPLPEMNSRANESVSCEVCHSITGFTGDIPFNFNYVVDPGKTKYTSRQGDIQSPAHEIKVTELHKSGDFCGICHNEKSPFGIWVKSTHLEWKEGPYYSQGVQCQTCHMPSAEFPTAIMGTSYKNTKLHLFHGGHDPGKVRGTIELRINPDLKEAEPGEKVKFTIALFNQKTGHKFPTGSVEDRILWMHVEAVDSKGNTYHLPVDLKGFEGEEYTVGSDVLAYQDMGIALGIENFEGIQRDGIPIGDRIFRKPYFDPLGRMTMQQWNTASQGVDYRIGPRETKVETCTFNLPDNLPSGELKITAILNYQLLMKPVAYFLKVPEEESKIIEVNRHSTFVNILD